MQRQLKNSIIHAKNSVERLINRMGYRIVKGGIPADMDPEFHEIYKKVRPYTMTGIDRMYALYKSTEYIVKAKIPGDFVECGVWAGGSAMIIAYTLQNLGDTKRKIYMYDTYEGMTEPSKEDFNPFEDKAEVMSRFDDEQKDDHNTWCYASLEDVKKNLSKTKYPKKNLIYIKGMVEETLPSKDMPKKIALLRLDTDFYESTKHEMEQLYPKIVRNGILLIDDYGHWAGSRKAIDEYLAKNNEHILLHRPDYTGRVGVKIS